MERTNWDMLGRSWFALVAAMAFLFLGCPADDDDDASDDDAGDDDAADDDAGDDDTIDEECPDGVVYLSGVITDDLTLDPDCDWVLRGGVFIGDDVSETVLTIEPGTTVYGETSTKGMLVITRNSKIMAEGTASEPIVFTSSKAPGDRARGDWGGLIINGNAVTNAGDEAFGEGGTGWYGGSDDGDDSGVLSYVRVEFAGQLISPDNELNGIAFQAVGSGTSIDHCQVHFNADDGIEFFGGAAEASYLLTTGIGDDNLDWTDGWRGKVQYFVAQQWDGEGDNGIEADNNGEENDASPRSHPTVANVTLIGVPTSEKSDLGMLLREGTAANLYNVVALGWNDACLDIDHKATYDNAWGGNDLSGELTLEGSLLACDTTFKDDDEGVGDDPPWTPQFTLEEFFNTYNDGNEVGADYDAVLEDAFNVTAPDYAPAAGGGADAGGVDPGNGLDATTFRGGVDPSDDWTADWTAYPEN